MRTVQHHALSLMALASVVFILLHWDNSPNYFMEEHSMRIMPSKEPATKLFDVSQMLHRKNQDSLLASNKSMTVITETDKSAAPVPKPVKKPSSTKTYTVKKEHLTNPVSDTKDQGVANTSGVALRMAQQQIDQTFSIMLNELDE
ncbi:MAG: hypothetical protein HQL69_12250 [Magnetococcales bacterium]|nr:hypothetical protein [Magnetococcales bacterium]